MFLIFEFRLVSKISANGAVLCTLVPVVAVDEATLQTGGIFRQSKAPNHGLSNILLRSSSLALARAS